MTRKMKRSNLRGGTRLSELIKTNLVVRSGKIRGLLSRPRQRNPKLKMLMQTSRALPMLRNRLIQPLQRKGRKVAPSIKNKRKNRRAILTVHSLRDPQIWGCQRIATYLHGKTRSHRLFLHICRIACSISSAHVKTARNLHGQLRKVVKQQAKSNWTTRCSPNCSQLVKTCSLM